MARSKGMLVVPLLLALSLAACQKEEGTAEQMGRQIDESMQKAGEKMEGAMEKAGEELEKMGEKMQDHAH